MDEEKKLIVQYERKQKSIKKDIKELKKKIPYCFSGFVLCTIGVIYLLQIRTSNMISSTLYSIIAGVSTIGIIALIYFININLKINKKRKENKILGSKMYKIMKL